VLAPVWSQGANELADPKQLLQYYLAREGELLSEQPFRGFVLQTYRLGERPQFSASGQTSTPAASFESGLTLLEAQWGAAYPNHDRNSPSVAAGTSIWLS